MPGTITSIEFAMDGAGVPVPDLFYGIARPGVCEKYAHLDDPNCPNVGWDGHLDTAQYVNGAHVLNVTATDISGNAITFNRRFMVFNQHETDPPLMYVDAPSHNQQVAGTTVISGWATDASGVVSLTVQVDNQPVTVSGLVYGTSRPGVCATYPLLEDPNCPDVGWQGTVDTLQISNGTHYLNVTATDAYGTSTIFNRRFVVFNQHETDPPLMYVDAPSHDQQVSGSTVISGWATDASGVVSLTVQVDNQPVTVSGLMYGTSRGDVCNVHQIGDPNCPDVGWQGTLNTLNFSNGTHYLNVTVTDAHGTSTIFDRRFQVIAAGVSTQ